MLSTFSLPLDTIYSNLTEPNISFWTKTHLFLVRNISSLSWIINNLIQRTTWRIYVKNLEDLPKPAGSAARPSYPNLSNLALSKVLKASINCSFLSASYRRDRWNLPLKDDGLGSRFTRGKKMMTTSRLEGSERAKMIKWTKEAYEVCETRCFKMDTSKVKSSEFLKTMVSLHEFYT